jgi:hypothetical protein
LRALRPGVSYWACLASRLLRDAGDNLLVFLPGGGDVIGARALVLAGGRTRAAVTASVLDKLSEILAQLPFVALALYTLSRIPRAKMPGLAAALPPLLATLAVLAGVAALVLLIRKASGVRSGLAARLIGRVRDEWALLAQELQHQRSGLPVATACHFAAWLTGGLQLWMAAHALGFPISPFAAIAIESVAYTGRAIVIFIPAGLIMQEAALVAGGLAFGLAVEQSLALAMVLRLRDVLFGAPLLAWPAFEFRDGRRNGERAAQ